MVVKMMRWRPWPPLVSKKYEVKLVVKTLTLQGCDLVRASAEKGFMLQIKWKGPKLTLSSLRRNAVARNFTREAHPEQNDDVVLWDEEFHALCTLNAYKDNAFHPWEIAFSLFNGLNQRSKTKVPVVGTATLNLAEFASVVDQKDFDLNIPLTISGGSAESSSPSLSISISLVELRAVQESTELVHNKSIVPVASASSPLVQSGDTTLVEKDELSTIKAGLRKVKILTEFVSVRKAKKTCPEEEGSEGNFSARSEDGEYNYPFDSDSLDDFEEGDSDEVKEDSSVRKSFSYGKLAYANAGGAFYSSMRVNGEGEDWFYYSNHRSDVGVSHKEDSLTVSVTEPYVLQSSRRSILPWRKRKLSFRSPKSKGEPLLKKAYGEEGGDDIDYDRRQLSSDESLSLGKTEDDSGANRSSVSEFGDDNFAVGSWEQKEVMSRDGHMKLQTQVFFASIDQRSERAAGESACTALVAVMADWFQNNRDLMPIKSQFDSLIREGSLEWRNLCENQTYRERFPDKHFDLETVIPASVHSLPFKNAQSDDDVKSEESKVSRKRSTGTEPPHKPSGVEQKPARKSASIHQQPCTNRNNQHQRHSDVAARSSTSSSSSTSISTKVVQQNKDKSHERKPQGQPTGNSLVLARISTSNENNENNKSQLKLTGNLLVNNTPRRKSVEYMPKSAELNSVPSSYTNASKGLMGNILNRNSDGNKVAQFLSPRMKKVDPEVSKSMGNDAYKQGRFEEALALYDRAIALDSNKAIYHCNKSAALIGLGRLQEAIVECEESIKLDPSYVRAHNRLATIYFRLGEAEKALNCNQITPYVDSILTFQAQALQNHLKKCIEARKVNAWSDILKETQSAISLGSDSAPQVYALQIEALLKLLRYQEAYTIYNKMPKFSIDWCTKIFGPACSAYLLMIGSMIYLASGRFEEAVTAAQQAVKVDPGNRELNAMVKKARAATSARMSGNLLFKASKFIEACAVYNEGLEHDPHNSVLLCNRAACRSKLGQNEKAIEDCNAALMVQPSYSKAKLRRANCNAKLERWEAAIQDYEMLLRERPGDEEVARALFEAQLQLKMLRGEDIKDLKFGSNLVSISSNDRFRHYVTSPGMAVVLFSNKTTHKKVLLVLEQISKRFPSVNFLKVSNRGQMQLMRFQLRP